MCANSLKRQKKDLITRKWHFALKRNGKAGIVELIARYLASCIKQKQGIGCSQTNMPNLEVVTVRVL